MPPAVFPVILGFLGVGLALRRGLQAYGLDTGAAELVQGLAVALWFFAVAGYGVKLLRRPGVIFEDLAVLPGRAGLAAGSLGLFLVAATVQPWWPGVAQGMMLTGIALHLGLIALIAKSLWRGPAGARALTPVWHLLFAGFILAGLTAAPLGMTALAHMLIVAVCAVAMAIWLGSGWQLIRRVPPAPLRPLLFIHLAPASLLASVARLADLPGIADVALAVAAAIALALLAAAKWVLVQGFSPLWGAMTFPLAAFASALFLNEFSIAGLIILTIATGVTGYVLIRVLGMWAKGSLAARTNAAEA